jgi:hypothetical protein
MLKTQYTPDSTIDVCNYKVKTYFNMYKESIAELHNLSNSLNYTCRGIYIWPYDLKYKPKLYNFDETNVIDVVRKTKDITEFKTIENHNIQIDNCAPIESPMTAQPAPAVPAVPSVPAAPQSHTIPDMETLADEKVLFLMKTLEPDIYNIYETENVNDKSIGIALVQTMNDSKILRTAFRDKNAMTVLKFACTYNDKFKKWRAVRQMFIS